MQTATETAPKLAYSVKEACQAIGISKTTLFRRIGDGRISAVRVGGRTVIPVRSLHALLEGEAA